MNPTEAWFTLAVDGTSVDLDHESKSWLDDAAKLMLSVLGKTNVYATAQTMLELTAGFGTSCAFVEDDLDTVIRLTLFEPGEFYIATNGRGEVDTVYRAFSNTVGQLVDRFGLDAVSPRVKQHYERGSLDTNVMIRHAVEPRRDRDTKSKLSKDMPFKSVYWEAAQHNGKPLRESGYKSFPALVARWALSANTAYGHGPGFQALGSVKQLQTDQLRKSQAIDYMVEPPIQVPIGMKNRENDYRPKGVSYYDPASGATGGVKTAFEVRLDIPSVSADIADIRNRIGTTFFSHLFTIVTDVDKQATAYEIAARQQEKVTLLGPVARRLNSDLHTRLVNILFERMLDAGLFPPPPESMQGKVLNVEYTSAFEAAVRAKSVAGMDKFLMSTMQLAQINTQVLDKIDMDKMIDNYADNYGVDPDILMSEDQIEKTRKARAEQQAQEQAQMKQMQMMDSAAKLGNAPADGTILAEGLKKVGNQATAQR
jgi:hypothetical protein